jgi:phosphohistidine phosphatase SixA
MTLTIPVGRSLRGLGIALLALWLARPAVAGVSPCPGDCNFDLQVTVNELVLAVNIALDQAPLSACVAADRAGDGVVSIDDLLAAVAAALQGCPAGPPATATGTSTTPPATATSPAATATSPAGATATPSSALPATQTVAPATSTPAPTGAETATAVPTHSAPASVEPTASPTQSADATATRSATALPSPSETPTQSSVATPTETATELAVPTGTASPTSTSAISETPPATPTDTSAIPETPPSATPTDTSAIPETPSATPTIALTATDTPTATESPVPTTSQTPSVAPSGLAAAIDVPHLRLTWTPGPAYPSSRLLRRLGEAVQGPDDPDARLVYSGGGDTVLEPLSDLLPSTAETPRVYHYAVYGCAGDVCESVGSATTIEPTLAPLLRAGGYTIFWRHAEATVCADRLDLGTAATTAQPNWWKSCDPTCPADGPITATARQLDDTGRAQAAAIGDQFDARGFPVGRVLSSEFCRAMETAQLMSFGPPIEPAQALTYFVYDEVARCAETFQLLAQKPQAGTNTALIGHAGNDCPPLSDLAQAAAALYKPDGAGNATAIATVAFDAWATLP